MVLTNQVSGDAEDVFFGIFGLVITPVVSVQFDENVLREVFGILRATYSESDK